MVKNNVIKKDVYNAKIKNIEDKNPDITNLANITNLASTTGLTAVENKLPKVSNLVKKKLTITQKLVELKRKLLIMIMINISLLQNLIS